MATLPTQRGSRNIELADVFNARFGFNPDPNEPIIITMDDFDKWAYDEGHYDHMLQGEINFARNALRNRINRVACGKHWIGFGREPFSVQVHGHARPSEGIPQTYAILPATGAFLQAGERGPKQIRALAENMAHRLDRLEDAARDGERHCSKDTLMQMTYTRASIKQFQKLASISAEHIEETLEGLADVINEAPYTAIEGGA